MSDEPETYPPCRCGREIKKLNAASDTPKCVGCGYVEALCRCARLFENRNYRSIDPLPPQRLPDA